MEKNQNNLAEEVLAHHGILGMKWGIRRFQPYPDGSYIVYRDKYQAVLNKSNKSNKASPSQKFVSPYNNDLSDETFYRYEYDGEGIYEALRKNMSFDEWKAFKQSPAATWLPIPPKYKLGDESYFTAKGNNKFLKSTYPIMLKYLDKNKIRSFTVTGKKRQKRVMIMSETYDNPCEEVLAHHGILGMKWGIRRYQPYPSDYSGDGKYMGKRMEKKLAKIEKRQTRHQAKTNTRIKNAVDTGDKKKLKKYQDEMTPEEYEKKYAETVKNGIDNAVKDRDKSALKKYKEDLNKRDYKHQQDRIDFKEAVDNDKNKKVDRLLSKVDPEDVTEATNLIKSRLALQDQKLSKIRQDSELMAKMDKLNSGVGKVSKFASNVSSITSSFMDINKKVTEYSSAAKDAADKAEKRKLNNVIKSGDIAKIEQYKDKMDYNQLKEAYGKAYVMNSREIDKAIADGNLNEVYKLMPWMDASDMSKVITKIKNLEDRGAAFSDDISYEDVLAHHGVKGMKWLYDRTSD